MKNLTSLIAASATLATLAIATAPAQAYDLGIKSLNTNPGFDPDSSLFDIGFTVSDTGATFTFENNDNVSGSTITSIFFGEAPVFGNVFDIDSFSYTGDGVLYKDPVDNGLPGSLGFTVESKTPVNGNVANGINYGEILNISFDWAGAAKTEDEIASLFNVGDLALAFHLQTIAPNGGSEFYGTCTSDDDCTTEKVPEPISGLVGFAGLAVVGLLKKRSA